MHGKTAKCPWTSLQGVARMRVLPAGKPLSGDVMIPGSKSYTNRALIIAGTARGETALKGALRSEDSWWCIESLRTLGVTVDVTDDIITVHGGGGTWRGDSEIFIGSAGTTARFLCGALALSVTAPVRVTATAQLSSRPVRSLFDALEKLGANIEYMEKDGHFPVIIHPPENPGGETEISGAISSQFVSGLLIGAPLAGRQVRINVTDKIVQENYVRMTLDIMHAFGVDAREQGNLEGFAVTPAAYKGRDYMIEADASTASYFMALAAVTGGEIAITNLAKNTLQPDITVTDIFAAMGCNITQTPRGLVVKGPEKLRGGQVFDMKQCSDTALTIAAIAPFADGPVTITNVAHIRKHESDRISVICGSLQKAGIRVEEREDGLTVHPGAPRPCVLDTHDDHRVAMSLAVMGAAGAGVTLTDPGCVSKTCPDFFAYLNMLGVKTEKN